MAEVRLEAYTFKITESINPTKVSATLKDLDNFFQGADFWTFFTEYVNHLDLLERNDNQKKVIKLKEDSITYQSDKRIISGIFESGAYGFESDIRDSKTNESKYKKQIDDAEILPFYFLVYIPKGLDIGIILLQRFGVNGIHRIFTSTFYDFFRSKYSALHIYYETFLSKELLDALLNKGQIKEMILRRYDLPTDKADKYNLKGMKNELLSMEYKLKSKKSTFFSKDQLKTFVKNKNKVFFSSPSDDAKNKISIVMIQDNTKRTIDLSDTGKLRPYYYVNEKEVVKDTSGHPNFVSLDKYAKKLLGTFIADLPTK